MNLKKSFSERQCCDDHGDGPTVYDLPVPFSLREEWRRLATRRHFLGRAGKTLGWAALSMLAGSVVLADPSVAKDASPESIRLPNFVPSAKRCIYLFMSGAPPQMDMWDYKPGLAAL